MAFPEGLPPAPITEAAQSPPLPLQRGKEGEGEGSTHSAMSDEIDLVRDVGMPDRFTPYTLFVTVFISITWALTAIPAMLPAFISPPIGGNGTIRGFYTLVEEASSHIENLRANLFQFDLSLEQAALSMSVFSFSTLLFGQFPCAASDKIGRKPIAFTSMLVCGLAGILCGVAPNYYTFLLGRAIQGVFFSACFNVVWVMGCESVPLSCHATASMIFGMMWIIGYVAIAPLAYFVSHWRHLLLITATPMVIYSVALQLGVMESLSFLLLRKNYDQVRVWMRRHDRFGKMKFNSSHFDRLVAENSRSHLMEGEKEWEGKEEGSPSVLGLIHEALSDGATRRHLVVYNYMWLVSIAFILPCAPCDRVKEVEGRKKKGKVSSLSIVDFLVYTGLAMLSTGINASNPYVSYTLSGLIELPSTFLLPVLMDNLGRRKTVILTHVETALALVAMCFVPPENGNLYMLVWLAAKFGTASSFIALFIYGSEIFPIKYRNICLGLSGSLCNIGPILAPFIASVASSGAWIVFCIYAFVSGLCACLITLLPETLHRNREEEEEKGVYS